MLSNEIIKVGEACLELKKESLEMGRVISYCLKTDNKALGPPGNPLRGSRPISLLEESPLQLNGADEVLEAICQI